MATTKLDPATLAAIDAKLKAEYREYREHLSRVAMTPRTEAEFIEHRKREMLAQMETFAATGDPADLEKPPVVSLGWPGQAR